MKEPSQSLESLSRQVEQLGAQQLALIEALKFLLPLAITIPATTSDSAQAVKQLKQALAQAEASEPRSEDFWYLAGAMSLMLSSRALNQHPNDSEVAAIFQGLRARKMQ